MIKRRSLFKLAGFSLAGAALGTLPAAGALAKAEKPGISQAEGLPVPSAEHPLLLNFNENALGMAAPARQAVIDSLGLAARYPDAQRADLITALAKKYAVEETQISIGNGSSENIQSIIQAFIYAAQKNKQPVQLVVPNPTFNYAELYAKAEGIPVVKVALTKDLLFDIPALQQAAKSFDGISIFYLCNPNNPTATITPATTLAEWIGNAGDNQFFLIDEAYAEFVSNPEFSSAIELVKKGYKNVAVTRTFSKIYALAGLRVGYAIAVPELIEQFSGFMSIDNTNLAGAVAALATLNDDTFLQRSLDSVNRSRSIVTQALDDLKLQYVPSNANFIFYNIQEDVKTFQQRMKSRHILVGRPFPPLTEWNRLTLGTPEEMTVFVKVLQEFHEKGWV